MKTQRGLSLDACPLYTWLKQRDSGFLPGIAKVKGIAETQLAHQVPRIFPHYTQHDINHSLRLLNYISQLIHDIDHLSELEVAILIHSAILHDIGMALGDEGLRRIRQDELAVSDIKFSAMVKLRRGDEALALQDLVRRVHADISAERIMAEFALNLDIPELEAINFAEDVAAVCRSHTKDSGWVDSCLEMHNVKGPFAYNLRYIAHILRLADLLDFDSRRTPLCLYYLISPQGTSDDEWRKHFTITNTEKVREDKTTGQKRIILYGKCEDVHLHRKLLKYIEWINVELQAAIRSTEEMAPQYRLFFRDVVDHRIRGVGYSISDYKLTIDFNSISTLLMGEHIYGDRRLGLRELIQNAIDACRVRQEIEFRRTNFGDTPFEPRISIIIDCDHKQIVVRDNGCGMTEFTIRSFFLNIGRSYYASEEFLLQDLRYTPIGKFGIGFLACFMISDHVIIRTRHYASTERCDIELEKGSEFISFARCEDTRFEGTEIVLSFQQFMLVFEDKVESVVNFLNEYVLTEDIKINVIDRRDQKTYPVSQSLRIKEAPNKGETELNIEPYLVRTHGYVRVRKSGTCIRAINEIAFDDKFMMVWDGDNLTKVSEYPLSELLSEEKLQFLTLDVFSESDRDDFETFLKRFDDLDAIIDKFKRDYQVTVFLTRDFPEQFDTDTDLNDYATVIDSVSVSDVLDGLGITGFVPRIAAESRSLLRHSKEEVYLPYSQLHGNISPDWWSGSSVVVFVRGIRISNATLPNLILPSTITLKNVAVNVTHPQIVPDISRNSFDEATRLLLSYAIHKATVKSLRECMADSQEERELLSVFLERFYGQDNSLIRASAEQVNATV